MLFARETPGREISTGRNGRVAGYTKRYDGTWAWAVHIDDDERVRMVGNADLEPRSD